MADRNITIDRGKAVMCVITAILAVALILAVIFGLKRINALKGELEIERHNALAYSDSLRYVEDGDYYEKLSYVIDENRDLKAYNTELYENVQKLKRKLLEGANITMAVRDTVMLKDTVKINVKSSGTYRYNDEWVDFGIDFFNDYDTVRGQTVLSMNRMDYSICTPIETYLTDDLSVIVRSPNPNVVITDIKSFVSKDIIENTRKYSNSSFGLHAGVGFGMGYNPVDRKMSPTIGLVVGIGYNYNFKLFKK